MKKSNQRYRIWEKTAAVVVCCLISLSAWAASEEGKNTPSKDSTSEKKRAVAPAEPTPAPAVPRPAVKAAEKPHLHSRVEKLSQLALKRGFPPTVVQKLTDDELYSLLQKTKTDIDAPSKDRKHTATPQSKIGKSVVAVVVPTVFFLCILAAVIGVLFFRARRDRQLQVTLRAMVEKGAEIPPELIAPPVKKGNDRRKGILLLTAGLGFSLCMALIAIGDPEALNGASVGLIPVLLGIGYLIVARMEGEQKNDEQGPSVRRKIRYTESAPAAESEETNENAR